VLNPPSNWGTAVNAARTLTVFILEAIALSDRTNNRT